MSLGQIGGVIGPQLLQSRFAHDGYETPFSICAAFVSASWFFTLLTWWLTRTNENDVQRSASRLESLVRFMLKRMYRLASHGRRWRSEWRSWNLRRDQESIQCRTHLLMHSHGSPLHKLECLSLYHPSTVRPLWRSFKVEATCSPRP